MNHKQWIDQQRNDMAAWDADRKKKEQQQVTEQRTSAKLGGVSVKDKTVTHTRSEKLPTYFDVYPASRMITRQTATPEPKRHRFWAVVVFVLGLVITLGGVVVMGGGMFSSIAVLAVGLIATVFFARRVW